MVVFRLLSVPAVKPAHALGHPTNRYVSSPACQAFSYQSSKWKTRNPAGRLRELELGSAVQVYQLPSKSALLTSEPFKSENVGVMERVCGSWLGLPQQNPWVRGFQKKSFISRMWVDWEDAGEMA